jgi:HlyD family secretion protein
MKDFFLKIKAVVYTHKIMTGLALIILVFGGYYGYQKFFPAAIKYKYITEAAVKTTISVSVTGSGQVSELNSIDLKPSTSGALKILNIKKGDQVKIGQVIAVVDQRDAIVSLNQAKASLANAQANYDTLIAGTDATDLRISQNSVAQAENSYNNALISQQNTIRSTAEDIAQAQKTLDDLVDTTSAANPTNKRSLLITALADKLNSDSSTLDSENKIFNDTNLEPTFSALDSSLSVNAKNYYNQALLALDIANSSLNNAQSYRSDANINQAVNDAIAALNKTQTSLNSCFQALKMTVSGSSISQSQIDSYKSSVSSQLTNASAAITAIQTAAQAFKDALVSAQNDLASAKLTADSQLASAKAQVQSTYNSWQTAKDQLAKLKEPPTKQEINSALTSLSSARAQYLQAIDTYNNTTITAPFDGQIAVVTPQKGDQVSASTVIATLITNQKVANIPLNEVDVAKIKLGEPAVLTFDAIDGLSLTGKIIDIDTLGTVSQGVVTYNVKISFDADDPQVKPGMSVNAAIITQVKTDVVAVPNAAIKVQGNNNYVQTLDAQGKPQNVGVQIGIADDSYTEIISGINEGDQVVTQTINLSTTKTATPTTSGIGSILGGSANRGAGGFTGGGATFRATGGARGN